MTTKKQRTKLFYDLITTFSKENVIRVNVDLSGDIQDFEVSAAQGTTAHQIQCLYDIEEITRLASCCKLSSYVKVKNGHPILIIH